MALICSGVYLIQAESIYLRFRLNPGPWGKEYVQINTVWRWQSTLGGGKLERRWMVSSTGRKLSNSQHYIVTVVICYTVTVLWYEWFVLSSTVHCCVLLCGHCRINMCNLISFLMKSDWRKTLLWQTAGIPRKKGSGTKSLSVKTQKTTSPLHFYCHWHENGLWKHELKLTAVLLFALCRRCMQLLKCSTNIIKQLGKLGHSRAIYIILVLGKHKKEAFILKAKWSRFQPHCSWLDGRLSCRSEMGSHKTLSRGLWQQLIWSSHVLICNGPNTTLFVVHSVI